MKNILERGKTIIIKIKNIWKSIPRTIYIEVRIMGYAKNHVVQCKKYPVSESASFDPPAPIHLFQQRFPGIGDKILIFLH